MTTITTRREQSDTASAARKVGGYSELVRLAAERRKLGEGSVPKRDGKTGKWSMQASPKG
jgi:hypothetical protein